MHRFLLFFKCVSKCVRVGVGRHVSDVNKNVINFDRFWEIQLKNVIHVLFAPSLAYGVQHTKIQHTCTHRTVVRTQTGGYLSLTFFSLQSIYQFFSANYIPMSFSSSTFLGRRNLLSFRKICMDAWSWLLLKAHTRSDVNWTFITKRWSNADPHLEQSILSPPLPPHTNHTSSTLATILHNYVFLPPFIFIDGVCSRIF